MRTITQAEWEATHPDYRCESDGQRYVLELDPRTGATVLAPVQVKSDEQTSGK